MPRQFSRYEGTTQHPLSRGDRREDIFYKRKMPSPTPPRGLRVRNIAMWPVWEQCGMSLREFGGLNYCGRSTTAPPPHLGGQARGSQAAFKMLENIDATPYDSAPNWGKPSLISLPLEPRPVMSVAALCRLYAATSRTPFTRSAASRTFDGTFPSRSGRYPNRLL